MNPELRDGWLKLSREAGGFFKPLAGMIAGHGKDDFSLLWLLADYAQLCVKFPSLVILAHSHRDEALRTALFASTPPYKLRRATFGQWLNFLRDAQKYVNQHYATHSAASGGRAHDILPLLNWDHTFYTQVEQITQKRNELAHGIPGRIHVTAARVDELADLALKAASSISFLRDFRFTLAGNRVLLQVHATLRPFDLSPFIVPGELEDDPRIFDRFHDETDAHFSSLHTTRSEPEWGAAVDRLLSSARPKEQTAEPVSLEAYCEERLRSFQENAGEDASGQDYYFDMLPGYLGRPAFAGLLREILASQESGVAVWLHGPRGIGKRGFLRALFTRATFPGHVVPVEASELGDKERYHRKRIDELLTSRRAQGEPGLAAPDGGRLPPLLLLLLGVDRWMAKDPGDHEAWISSIVAHARASPNTTLLLVADSSGDSRSAEIGKLPLTVLAMPPLERSAAGAFFDAVREATRAQVPNWEGLPAQFRDEAWQPRRIVRFCRDHVDQPFREGLALWQHELDRWQQMMALHETFRSDMEFLVSNMREHRRPFVAMGDYARHLSARSPKREKGAPAHSPALEQLQLLGYIEERVEPDGPKNDGRPRKPGAGRGAPFQYVFSEYEWLRAGLAWLLPSLDDATDAELDALVRETADFHPLGEAVAEKLEAATAGSADRLWSAILQIKPANRHKLIEGILIRLYSHSDPEAWERCLHAVLHAGDEAFYSGCAAAAGQLLRAGAEARPVGKQILKQVLDASVTRGFTHLAAVLHNEYAEWAAEDRERGLRLRHLQAALEQAIALRLDGLAQVARNNLANLYLQLPPGPHDPARWQADAARALATLEPALAGEATQDNWSHVNLTLELHAEALRRRPPLDRAALLQAAARLEANAEKFGTPRQRSAAYFNIARIHATLRHRAAASSAFARAKRLGLVGLLSDDEMQQRAHVEQQTMALL